LLGTDGRVLSRSYTNGEQEHANETLHLRLSWPGLWPLCELAGPRRTEPVQEHLVCVASVPLRKLRFVC